jgi:hypothetical protein
MDNRNTKDKPLPGPDEIRALLEFLPIFEDPAFLFGEEGGGERGEDGSFSFPYYTLSKDASRFRKALHDLGFIRPFDWGSWHEGVRYMHDPEALASADLDTLCKLLTAHLRQERFCDGHLASMYKCGHLTGILRRLNEMRQNRVSE